MTDEELIERLQRAAEASSNMQRELALKESLRQADKQERENALCQWPWPNETPEGIAADRLQSLTARVAELEADKAHYANLYANKAEQLSRADTELTRLKAVNEELVGALGPFANVAKRIRETGTSEAWLEKALFYMGDDTDPTKWSLTGRAFDNALQALSRVEQGEKG